LPWIRGKAASNRSSEELVHHLESFKDNNDVEWDVADWWMYQRIPGYSLTWEEVDGPLWKLLYRRHRELFIRPSIPVQRLMWWRFNAAKSSCWAQQEAIL
jgi:hypothetical protein